MNGAIAEPRDDVRRDRTEDRQLRDPDRQDRRGHRAQGQGHQHDPAGDRRRHRGRRRRHGRHGVASARRTAPQVDEAQRRIELILDPPTAEVGADLHGPGREHHQVRCVRQHPPGPRRPAPHLQARSAASASTGSRTCSTLGDEVEVTVDDIDQTGKLSLSLVGDDAERWRRRRLGDGRRRRRAASGSERGAARDRATAATAAASRRPATATVASFEAVLGRARPREEFGDLGPAEAAEPAAAATATAAVRAVAAAAAVAAGGGGGRGASMRRP